MSEERLSEIRAELRRVTREILRLAAERERLARKAGELKKRFGLPVVDRRVEAGLLRESLKLCSELGLSREFCRRIISLLMIESVKAQKKISRDTGEPGLREIFAHAVRLQRSGRRVIRLEIGEPDFGAPQPVIEETCRALKEGRAKYLPPEGVPELREAVAERLNRLYGLDLKSENVLVTMGGIMAVYLAVELFTGIGDEIMALEPAWPLYRRIIELYGRRYVGLRTRMEDGWVPRPGQLGEEATENTKLLIINYPNNPTGRVLNPSKLKRLVEEARELGMTILSDEVYMDYCFRDGKAPSILQLLDDGYMVVGSFSKAWGMTGYRVGYLVAREDAIKKAIYILNTIVTCVPEFIQRAALAAVRNEEAVRRNVEEIKRRLEAMAKALSRSRLIEFRPPEGAMYLFPKVKIPGFRSARFALKLLEERGVAVAPGSGFGPYPEHLRLSAVRPIAEIEEGVGRLVEALEEWAEE